MEIRLFDTPTATTLAQILPVLLLSLMVEIRRLELHRRGKNIVTTRALLGAFFGLFGIVETVLVLSIDGRLFPLEWSDFIAAILIFALLVMLFVFSMMGTERKQK